LRAGLAASTETDQAALRAVIDHERRVELAFENHRWFDLVRTGEAISVMTAFRYRAEGEIWLFVANFL